jgi:hypothetical protein
MKLQNDIHQIPKSSRGLIFTSLKRGVDTVTAFTSLFKEYSTLIILP